VFPDYPEVLASVFVLYLSNIDTAKVRRDADAIAKSFKAVKK
jgi:hypothetical protein